MTLPTAFGACVQAPTSLCVAREPDSRGRRAHFCEFFVQDSEALLEDTATLCDFIGDVGVDVVEADHWDTATRCATGALKLSAVVSALITDAKPSFAIARTSPRRLTWISRTMSPSFTGFRVSELALCGRV